jgi:hypothetical protein
MPFFLRHACWSILSLLTFASFPAQAALVANVLTLNSSRNGAGRSEDFGSGSFYNAFRSDLLSTANFGPSGTLQYSVNLLNPVASISAANLSAADVVIWSQRTLPSAAEKIAITNFVSGGGGLMVISDASPHFVDLLGGDIAATNSSFSSQAGLYSAVATPMTNGAFGNVTGASLNVLPGASYRMVAGAGGFAPTVQTGIHWGLLPSTRFADATAITGMLGLGRIAIFGDDDIFMQDKYLGTTFGPPESAANRIAAKNTFSWLANGGSPTAVPEPGTAGLLAFLALAPMATRLRKRFRRETLAG